MTDAREHQAVDEPRTRFGALLILVLLTFVVTAFDHAVGRAISLLLTAALVVATFRISRVASPKGLFWTLLVAVGTSVAFGLAFDAGSSWLAVATILQAAIFAAMVVAVSGAVLRSPVVDLQTVLGAVSAYALIGMAFGWLYLGVDLLDDAQFDIDATSWPEFFGFSFVVLTTLGFGNQLPTEPFAERLVAVEAVLAQIFLAVFIARIVSLYGTTLPRSRRATREDGETGPPPEPTHGGDE